MRSTNDVPDSVVQEVFSAGSWSFPNESDRFCGLGPCQQRRQRLEAVVAQFLDGHLRIGLPHSTVDVVAYVRGPRRNITAKLGRADRFVQRPKLLGQRLAWGNPL